VAIDRNTNAGERPTVTSLAPQINLDTIKGRSLCVRYAVNITRVVVSLQTAYPEGSVARLDETVNTGSSVVTIYGQNETSALSLKRRSTETKSGMHEQNE
jgi:hypothetical protein